MPTAVDYKPGVKKWLQELDASGKREEDFRKEGRRITAIYEAEKKQDNQFNILFSNTETLSPALYNSLPRPVVERRYKDADPMGKMASDVTKRTLQFLIDSNDQDYSNFDDMVKQAVLEALLPGRGITRFKFDADVAGPEGSQEVKSEMVCGEEVPWDRFRMGYAKKWVDVPWIAFEHFMNEAEIKANFGEKDVQYTIKEGLEDEDKGESGAKEGEGQTLLCHVFEVWDKVTKKVLFISPGHEDYLKEVDDPLALSGFYPIPRPLQLTPKISSLLPTPLYMMYEEQAKELNIVTGRINKIMRALKVRGFYDSTLTGLSELMNSPDNTLLPAENVASMLQGQTIDRAIWYFPIEKLVGVLQQLYMQREQVKSTIYEITGVSDIIRGSSVASETATAQNLKSQWGTLRLKRAQKEVMRYVRDCLRLMAEIAVEKLSIPTLKGMTGLPYPTAQEKQQAQMAMQQLQQQAQIAAQQAQMAGQQPPPPPPQLAQIQQVLSQPSWEDIIGLLKSDLQRHYRIDIETNSTVDAEATEDKQDVAEFMNAMSQFLNGIAPMIEQGYMSFDTAKAMLLAIVRRYRFGTEVEDQINAMQAPPPKGPESDPKVQAEQMKIQSQQKADEQEAKHKEAMMQLEMEERQMDMQLKREEMDFKREEMQMKRVLAAQQHQDDLQAVSEKAIVRQQQQALQQQAAEEKVRQQAQQGNANADV